MALVPRFERLGRIVRRMRVVEMDPSEKARRAGAFEPGQRMVGDFVAGTIHAAERQRLVLAQIEVIEIRLEALRDAPLVIEHVRADEAAGGEAARLQSLRQGRLAIVEKESAVVADAVCRRKLTREDR